MNLKSALIACASTAVVFLALDAIWLTAFVAAQGYDTSRLRRMPQAPTATDGAAP